MDLSAGLSAAVEMAVTDADTAETIGSGEVPVLATPRVIALMEAATVAVVAGRLDATQTTVGTRVEVDHHAPTLVGATVVAEARLRTVEGRKLGFEVVLREGTAVTAQGRIDRVVVDRERFLAKASAKTA